MKTISIEGMMCDNCKKHVEKALNSIEGVTSVKVSLENKNAIIECNLDVSDETIKETVKEAGYEVTEIIS